MLRIEPGRAPITVRPSGAMDDEEQLELRLRQMISSHADAHLFAQIDKYIGTRIQAAVEAACARQVLTGGGHLLGTGEDPPVARMQASLAARVDTASLDAAIEAIVAARVEALFRLAAKMRHVAPSGVDVTGIPRLTEEEALRRARGMLEDPRLASLDGGIDIDADER